MKTLVYQIAEVCRLNNHLFIAFIHNKIIAAKIADLCVFVEYCQYLQFCLFVDINITHPELYF